MGFVSVETEDEAHRAALERIAGECVIRIEFESGHKIHIEGSVPALAMAELVRAIA
ncbi:MAG: hypothetical protein KDJ75_09825 [Alphaproteobacteria bacterium]|nr:hypothetical protein [Alphaproteobacteria bacterium]